MNTQSNCCVFYDSTWLKITITTFDKIFSREEMLADVVVFRAIRQIKLMICHNKFPRKNTFVTDKIKSCRKKKTFINGKIIVCSKTSFSKNSYHIETSQLVWNSNQLTGFYMVLMKGVSQHTISSPNFFPVSLFTQYRLLHCIQKY